MAVSHCVGALPTDLAGYVFVVACGDENLPSVLFASYSQPFFRKLAQWQTPRQRFVLLLVPMEHERTLVADRSQPCAELWFILRDPLRRPFCALKGAENL